MKIGNNSEKNILLKYIKIDINVGNLIASKVRIWQSGRNCEFLVNNVEQKARKIAYSGYLLLFVSYSLYHMFFRLEEFINIINWLSLVKSCLNSWYLKILCIETYFSQNIVMIFESNIFKESATSWLILSLAYIF